jgi:hypothetical protein
MKPPKAKKCKNCAKPFVPQRSTLEIVCSSSCAIEYGKSKPKKISKQSQLEPLKTISDYRKELQTKINLIVRLIDLNHVCISCGKKPNKPFAGHYHAVGSNEALRYNLFNIFIQCMRCNGFNGGMLLDYGKGLKQTFGATLKDYCETFIVSEYKSIKLNQNDLIEASRKANEIIKFLQLENREYDNRERIALRKQFNKMLKIYDTSTNI